MNTRTQEYTMSIAQGEGRLYGDDSIDALTKEGLSVALDITVLYRLNTDKADEVYKNIGVQYEEKIIRPQIRTSIREVVSQYLAREIYAEKRSEAQQAIMDNLQANIDARGITIENVLVRNIDLPEKLENSIEEKLTAEQESQKYEFLLDKEAKEAERKRVEAEGQRDAQAIINESLTDRYLYYQYVNNLKDRPGTIYVPVSPTSGLPVFKGIQ
jgi:regulator of protease activity HflC (stomatin/prohibitin superfamily)